MRTDCFHSCCLKISKKLINLGRYKQIWKAVDRSDWCRLVCGVFSTPSVLAGCQFQTFYFLLHLSTVTRTSGLSLGKGDLVLGNCNKTLNTSYPFYGGCVFSCFEYHNLITLLQLSLRINELTPCSTEAIFSSCSSSSEERLTAVFGSLYN